MTDIERWKLVNEVGQEIISAEYVLDSLKEKYVHIAPECKNKDCEYFDIQKFGNCRLGVPWHFCEEYRDTEEEF